MFLPAKHNENNEEKKVQINPLNTLPEIYNFAKKLRFKVGVDKEIDIKLAHRVNQSKSLKIWNKKELNHLKYSNKN